LCARAIQVAGAVLELGGAAAEGAGAARAEATLQSGAAWRKFQAICEAQAGMREPPRAAYTHVVTAERDGRVISIDNRRLARMAKLAGAPDDKAAGIEMHVSLDDEVEGGAPLFTLHAESPGEIAYALNYAASRPDIILLELQ
jgi:thymidine phosphorylase